MNDIRTMIQTELDRIATVDSGVPTPDSMVEEGVTYFGYELEERFVTQDLDNRNFMQVILTGRIVRRKSSSENTLAIVDAALEKIKEALKNLNIDYSYRDVSQFTDGFQKIAVEGSTYYYEKNKDLI